MVDQVVECEGNMIHFQKVCGLGHGPALVKMQHSHGLYQVVAVAQHEVLNSKPEVAIHTVTCCPISGSMSHYIEKHLHHIEVKRCPKLEGPHLIEPGKSMPHLLVSLPHQNH